MKFTQPVPVIIDVQEKKLWSFPLDGFTMCRRRLVTGDYSLDGFEGVVSIERKSLGDLVSTVIVDWIRFRKELYRLAGMDHAIIAIESDLSAVVNRQYDMDVDPERVLGRITEITVDHGIPVCWWGDASFAEKMAARYLKMVWGRIQ